MNFICNRKAFILSFENCEFDLNNVTAILAGSPRECFSEEACDSLHPPCGLVAVVWQGRPDWWLKIGIVLQHFYSCLTAFFHHYRINICINATYWNCRLEVPHERLNNLKATVCNYGSINTIFTMILYSMQAHDMPRHWTKSQSDCMMYLI